MSDFNEDLIMEINLLRTNTKKYAKTVSKYKNYFKGNILCLPIQTLEFKLKKEKKHLKKQLIF